MFYVNVDKITRLLCTPSTFLLAGIIGFKVLLATLTYHYPLLVLCLSENANTIGMCNDYLLLILDHLILSGWPVL